MCVIFSTWFREVGYIKDIRIGTYNRSAFRHVPTHVQWLSLKFNLLNRFIFIIEHAERAIEMMTMFLTITLRGDTDFAETLLTKNQRQENEDPRSLIMQFVKKNAGTEGVDLNEILDHLESVLGLSHDRSEKYIKEMHEQGRIMEFRTGRWMKG